MRRLTTLSLNGFKQGNKLLLFTLLTFCFSRIHAQTNSFSGTIGKYPIYLQMTIEGSQVSGYYFYKNKLIDLSLAGSFKSGLVILKSSNEYGQDISDPETFKFKWPNKTIEGTWSQKGKSLPLKLAALTTKETSSPKCSNPYFKKEVYDASDLTKVKVSLFKLKEVNAVQTINGVKIRNFEEVNTKISLFRIDSGLVAEKQKDANLYLEFLQISEYLSSLECASYSTYGSDYSYNVSDITISNDLISFSVFAAFYCGGAHPDENDYGVNVNLTNHKTITSEDYLLTGKDELFQERVIAYLSRMQPEYFNPEAQSNPDDVGYDCDYYNMELWTTNCSFTFTNEGLKLHPSFSHYMAPCLDPEWAVIPYSELKDLIKPEYYSKLTKLKN